MGSIRKFYLQSILMDKNKRGNYSIDSQCFHPLVCFIKFLNTVCITVKSEATMS